MYELRCRSTTTCEWLNNDDGGEGGTWRYCFERMRWILGPSGVDERGVAERANETQELEALRGRIARLEATLLRHGISSPS